MSKKKRGIDISKWQGDIDAGQVKNSGIEFVILREGYRQEVDSRFFENVRKCKEVGLAVMGVYHFSYALNVEQAKQEAQTCIANLRKAGLDKDTIVFFDFEYDTVIKAATSGVTLGKAECNEHTKAFCETVESLGYKAGVYFNIDYYRNWYDHNLLDKYIKWLADWSGDADYLCSFHQYSSEGSVPGINGNVDMNYYFVEENSTVETGIPQKPIDEVAREVIQGAWGNGDARKKALTNAGYNYTEIQNRVNAILSGNTGVPQKPIDEVAREVIQGKWGNGLERKDRLTKAGYDYSAVQSRVNALM